MAVGFPGAELPPGWTVEAALAGIVETLRGRRPSVRSPGARGLDARDQRLMCRSSPAGRCTREERGGLARAVHGRFVPAARRTRRRWRLRVPGVAALVRGAAEPLPPHGDACATRPGRSSTRRRSRSASGASRSGGWTCCVNGARVFIRGVNRHDFDQHTGRVVTPDQMRADLVQMKRFGFNAVRTSHYPNDPAFLDLADELGPVRRSTRRTSSRTRSGARCATTRATSARGWTGCRGWPSGTRTTPRSSSGRWATNPATAPTTRRPPPGCAATTRRRPLHYEGAIRFDWASDQGVSDLTCPMYPPIDAIVEHATNGTPAPPADHVRVLARDGQQQRHARRVLGRRSNPRPGCRAASSGSGGTTAWCSALPDGTARWAYGGDFGDAAQRRQLLPRRPGLAGPAPEARHVGAQAAGRSRSASRRRRRPRRAGA